MTKSCFIEGTNIQHAWDSTSLGWLKQCPRLYQYQMIDDWQPRNRSFHLDFGSWFHKGVELYDKAIAAGAPHDLVMLDVVQQALIDTWDKEADAPWVSGDPNKNRSTLIRSLIWYLDEFGTKDPCTTLILPNGTPAVELSFKMEIEKTAPNGNPYVLCGHIDRIVEFAEDKYVVDYKTTKSTLAGEYLRSWNPDNQMSLYVLAGQVVFNTPVSGVIISAAQILVGSTNFARPITTRSKAQTEEWLKSLSDYLDASVRYAEANFWPMNDKACRGCAFREVCSIDPVSRDAVLESRYVKRTWNPLDVR